MLYKLLKPETTYFLVKFILPFPDILVYIQHVQTDLNILLKWIINLPVNYYWTLLRNLSCLNNLFQ
jgi:hypothetical protein